jgi:hypothetical protein
MEEGPGLPKKSKNMRSDEQADDQQLRRRLLLYLTWKEIQTVIGDNTPHRACLETLVRLEPHCKDQSLLVHHLYFPSAEHNFSAKNKCTKFSNATRTMKRNSPDRFQSESKRISNLGNLHTARRPKIDTEKIDTDLRFHISLKIGSK